LIPSFAANGRVEGTSAVPFATIYFFNVALSVIGVAASAREMMQPVLAFSA
jgi:hypothetical protein